MPITLNGNTGTTGNLANGDLQINGVTVGKGAGTIATNTAVGASALNANTTGATNTAVGSFSLLNSTTANGNTAIGYASARDNTTGGNLSAVGYFALESNTTGGNNTALGVEALTSNTTASNNTAVGYQAGYSQTTGSNSTFLGRYAGYGSTTSSGAIHIGNSAGYASNGDQNLFIGTQAGYNSTGSSNTFVGAFSGTPNGCGYAMTTGSKNTILGAYSGNNGGLDIRTASNYIVLSDGDGNPRGIFDGSGNLIVGATATNAGERLFISGSVADNIARMYCTGATPFGLYIRYTAAAPNSGSQDFLYCSDSATNRFRVYANGGVGNYSANNVNLSDETLKKDITLAPNYLDKLCQIPVKTYLYKDQTDTNLNIGVIAQEVKEICPELVGTMDIGGKDSPDVKLAIYETDFKYAMLKAIQELKAEVDSLKQQINNGV
jgi:hypothetical protein